MAPRSPLTPRCHPELVEGSRPPRPRWCEVAAHARGRASFCAGRWREVLRLRSGRHLEGDDTPYQRGDGQDPSTALGMTPGRGCHLVPRGSGARGPSTPLGMPPEGERHREPGRQAPRSGGAPRRRPPYGGRGGGAANARGIRYLRGEAGLRLKDPHPQPLSLCAGRGAFGGERGSQPWPRRTRCWPRVRRSAPLALRTGRGVGGEGCSGKMRPARSPLPLPAAHRARGWGEDPGARVQHGGRHVPCRPR